MWDLIGEKSFRNETNKPKNNDGLYRMFVFLLLLLLLLIQLFAHNTKHFLVSIKLLMPVKKKKNRERINKTSLTTWYKDFAFKGNIIAHITK